MNNAYSIKDIHNARQKDSALVFGITPRGVRKWECPRNNDGTYDLPAVISWKLQREVDRIDAMCAGQNTGSPAIEKYREEQFKMARLKRLEMEKTLLPREAMQSGLMQLAGLLRSAGKTLQTEYGPDAQNILDEALDEFEALVKEQYGEEEKEL